MNTVIKFYGLAYLVGEELHLPSLSTNKQYILSWSRATFISFIHQKTIQSVWRQLDINILALVDICNKNWKYCYVPLPIEAFKTVLLINITKVVGGKVTVL